MDAVVVSSVETKAVNYFPSAASAKDIASVAVLPAGSKIHVSGMAEKDQLASGTRTTLGKLIVAIKHPGLPRADVVRLKAFLQPMFAIETLLQEVVQCFEGHTPQLLFVEWISLSSSAPIEIELMLASKGDVSRESGPLALHSSTARDRLFVRVALLNHRKPIYVFGL